MEVRTNPAQEDALAQMRDVLRGDFLALRVSAYALDEDLDAGAARVRASLVINDGEPVEIVGEGVGMIDAFFRALMARFAPEYSSLESITFSSLQVRGLIDERTSGPSTAAAKAAASIGVRNSYGTEFLFSSVSESVSRSSVAAVTAAVEYFVNSERTYLALYRALRHSESEGRADLVAKYTSKMSDMVRNTSYSKTIERLSPRVGGAG